MHDAIKQRRMLRLVKSSAGMKDERKTIVNSESYFKQVERYADQIRKTRNADEIIRILDVVLSETRGLRFSDEIFSAKEQVKHAEEKIESLKNELEQLKGLVQTDQMTGAYNRRGLDEIFKREAARADRNGQSMGIALIDLDDFKQINDSLGHPYGDNVLINLVTVAKEVLRPSDTVARYGGEEFVIMLPDIEMEQALTVMYRLQNSLSKHSLIRGDDLVLPITFSAGVAIRSFGEPLNSVIGRADKALYQAKRTGKSRAIPALT